MNLPYLEALSERMGLALDCNNLGHNRQALTTIGRLYFYLHTTALSLLTNAGKLKEDSFPVYFPKKKVAVERGVAIRIRLRHESVSALGHCLQLSKDQSVMVDNDAYFSYSLSTKG